MILEIEDKLGKRICAMKINPYDEEERMPIVESTIGEVSIADYDFDDIFDTNDYKIRISLDDIGTKKIFRTGNIIGFKHKSQNAKDLMQEYKSYEALLNSLNKKDYYDCGVIIENYFGHIDYWYEFGYDKTHEDIVSILHSNLLSELTNIERGDDKRPLQSFCKREMRKIEYIMKEKYDIDDMEEAYQEGWLP